MLGVSPQVVDEEVRAPMVFWLFRSGTGEPEDLWAWGGRISYCSGRVRRDETYLNVFGSENSVIEALCQLELCLELNSYCAFLTDDTTESSEYLLRVVPHLSFEFWPCLTAFPFDNIKALALRLFAEARKQKSDILKLIFIDPALANAWVQPGGSLAFARFIGYLQERQTEMFFQHRRMPPRVYWPKEFQAALQAARKKSPES